LRGNIAAGEDHPTQLFQGKTKRQVGKRRRGIIPKKEHPGGGVNRDLESNSRKKGGIRQINGTTNNEGKNRLS